MIEKLKEVFKTNRKYSLNELCRLLKDYKKEDIENALNSLEHDGSIISMFDKYQIFPNNFSMVNIKIDRNGCGYFYIDKQRYNIAKNLNGCLNNDLCVINTDTLEIVKIVERKSDLVIGTYMDNKIILDSNLDYDVILKSSNTKNLVEGSVVLLRVKQNDEKLLYCDLVEVMGHKDDPDINIKAIAISNSFEINFSKEYLRQLESIKSEVTEEDIKDRLDLRNELIYTIDCDETKDRDDAISVSINEKGNYVVGVHIADVSYYVKPGSEIYKEAYKRATSVYMADTVIPMIHHILSNGICSLNPSVDRLTISCIVELNKNGEIVNYDIKKSVINSKKKMTYSEVNQILKENIIPIGYEGFIDNLKLANEVSLLINKTNKGNGYLQFGNREVKYTNDEFILTTPRAAEKIIEMYMLLANKVVAEHFAYMPFPFRVHEVPDDSELDEAFNILRNMGYDIPELRNYSNKAIQGILKNLYESGDFSVTGYIMLKSLKKARYSNENVGHFGLNFDYYTHFTSPIRRFNDLLVNVIISKYISGNINDNDLNYLEQNLGEICEHISEKEVLADEAEKEALEFKMAEYMEDHVNEYYNGKIIDINAQGVMIKLENNIVGVAHIKDIDDGNYYFDNNEYCLKHMKNDSTFKIGDYVRNRVIYASKNSRKINFDVVENISKVKRKALA